MRAISSISSFNMRRFLIHIGIYVAATLLLMFAFDGIYTAIYSKSIVRNKIQLLVNGAPQHYDVIIVGSSRAENHLVPERFQRYGLKTYNIAMSGANLCENALQLKLFFDKGNTARNILLQVDTNFQTTTPATGIRAYALPYLWQNDVVYEHYAKAEQSNLFAERRVPFYRYMIYDTKIGFREVAFTVLEKQNNTIKTKGFWGLEGVLHRGAPATLPTKVATQNRYYDEIKQICKAQQVQLIAFEAPFCANSGSREYFAKLKENNPELYDYNSAVSADSLFATCGHMNTKGAEAFTDFIIQKHFSEKKALGK
jgi:hypothetical protein